MIPEVMRRLLNSIENGYLFTFNNYQYKMWQYSHIGTETLIIIYLIKRI